MSSSFFCRVAAVNGVTAFLLFMGKLFVVGIIGKNFSLTPEII